MLKRTVRIARHNTSVSLEPEFWQELKSIAVKEGRRLKEIIEQVDRQRATNLSSALRLFVLHELKKSRKI